MKVKHAKHIILFIIIFFLGGVIAVYITRNQWFGIYLKQEIERKSSSKVILTYDSLKVEVFKKTLALYNPKLTFKNAYLDKNKNLYLNEVQFKRLKFHNLNLWDFVIKKSLRIDLVSIISPVFQISLPKKEKKINSGTGMDPAKIITLFRNKELPGMPFPFLIKRLNIIKGKIDLKQKDTPGEAGGAKYKIYIYDLGTGFAYKRADNKKLYPVSYKNARIFINDFYRKSKKNNYKILIDSLYYHSKNRDLIISGLHGNKYNENKQSLLPADFNLNWIRVMGNKNDSISPESKGINFHNVHFIGGNITLQEPKVKHIKKKDAGKKLFQQIFQNYIKVHFDTLQGERLNFSRITSGGITNVKVKRINFYFNDLLITKNQDIKYKLFNTQINHLYYSDIKKGFDINTGNIRYSKKDSLLAIFKLDIEKKCNINRKKEIKLNIEKADITHFSLLAFTKKRSQKIMVTTLKPVLYYQISENCSNKVNNKTLLKWIKPLDVKQIKLENGIFMLKNSTNDTLKISKINLFANGLIGLLQTGKTIDFDSIYVDAGLNYYKNHQLGMTIRNNAIKWINDTIILKKTLLNYKKSEVYFPEININEVNIKKLILTKDLIVNQVIINKPNISLKNLKLRTDSNGVKQQLPSCLSSVTLRHLFISGGRLTYNTDEIKAAGSRFVYKTNIKVLADDFQINTSTQDLNFIPATWKITLSKSYWKSKLINGNFKILKADNIKNNLSVLSLNFSKNTLKDSLIFSTPSFSVSQINFSNLIKDKKVLFKKGLINSPIIDYKVISSLKNQNESAGKLPYNFKFDTLTLKNGNIKLTWNKLKTKTILKGNQINIIYHPNLFSNDTDSALSNSLKNWDFSFLKLKLSKNTANLQIIADRLDYKSDNNNLTIKYLSGNNIPKDLTLTDKRPVYSYFLLKNISLDKMFLNKNTGILSIKKWNIPEIWLNIIVDGKAAKKKIPLKINTNLFSKENGFLQGLDIDTTFFDNVNIGYLYNNRKKLVNFSGISMTATDIHVDSTINTNGESALFNELLIDTHGKEIISGDSLYLFKTKDIRINLPKKIITMDSLSVLPRYPRKLFYKRIGHQTDRISLYGKSIVANSFNLNKLINEKVFSTGSISFNQFNVLFERDKRYPPDTTLKPMPFDMLKEIPILFKSDSVLVKKSMISYYEFHKKSLFPGIFFIDNFHLRMIDVTNDFALVDSASVLKIQGGGNLMRQTPLSFVLVMPYFAPKNQFWFSAHTDRADLSQFNSLMQNVVGISIKSGNGLAEVPYVTGNDEYAKGNMLFLYKNLKLRLYNKKKAERNKGIGSPFVNFMLNNLMIRSNNPKLLKTPKKGIIYYKRNPRKSFVNYIWKSSLSGILSTMGFNTKLQRMEKKAEKKQQKDSLKNK